MAAKPDAVVDFTPECGLLLASVHCNTPYTGLAWNRAHQTTLAGIFVEAAKRHLAGRPLPWDDIATAVIDRNPTPYTVISAKVGIMGRFCSGGCLVSYYGFLFVGPCN